MLESFLTKSNSKIPFTLGTIKGINSMMEVGF